MTDIQFLMLLRTAFNEYLNPPEGKVASFQQLLEVVELFRDQVRKETLKQAKTQSNETTEINGSGNEDQSAEAIQ